MNAKAVRDLHLSNEIIQLCKQLSGSSAVNNLCSHVYSFEWAAAKDLLARIPATTQNANNIKKQILEKIMNITSENSAQSDGIQELPVITLHSVFAIFDESKQMYKLASGSFASKECVENAIAKSAAKRANFVDVSNVAMGGSDDAVSLNKVLGTFELTFETDITGVDVIMAKLKLQESLLDAHKPGMREILQPLDMTCDTDATRKYFTSVLIVNDMKDRSFSETETSTVVNIQRIVKYTTK